VSDLDDASLDPITSLYRRVFPNMLVVSSVEIAEMIKLYENCQRMVCAAYANEMANACISLGIDASEVSRAVASKPFGYIHFQPGPVRQACLRRVSSSSAWDSSADKAL
jgi:UDP-N-acetyl-D-mannosaminuronate dehydrogenase